MYDTSKLFFPLVATSAVVLVGSLALLQTDVVSRKILDPAQLNTKRRIEYRFDWKKAVEKAISEFGHCLAGFPQENSNDTENFTKNTKYISNDDDLDALVMKIVHKEDTSSKFHTLKVDKDPNDPTEDLYLFMVQEEISSNDRVLFQVPLIKFGMKLAKVFENQLTMTTLCFVADASAGKATRMLESLMRDCTNDVAVVSEPFWMIQIARLAEANIMASAKIRKLIFALCRLDAVSVRNEVGYAKTVMFTLPGQAVVSTLLPLVHSVFPKDRHVFAYDECVASVKRGIYTELIYRRSDLFPNLEPIIRCMCKDPVLVTTPFPSNVPLSHDTALGGSGGSLERALAEVPLQQARNVEAWISSVDAYLKLKNGEPNNGYLPYCFKLAYLISEAVGNFKHGTDSYWSLKSLIQYVTGCQGRAISEEVFHAAKEWLEDYILAEAAEQEEIDNLVALTEYDRTRIQNCCFQHKLILLCDTTLQDTVLPINRWATERTSRNGCSCCGPSSYDLLEEEENVTKSGRAIGTKLKKTDDTNQPMKTSVSDKTNGYVDATKVYAFDPMGYS